MVTPYLGGGFGRRADLGYIVKAVEIARKFRGTPIQTIWSRAEDIRDDVYRPGAMADVAATLDFKGQPTSFVYRIAVPSVTDQFVARTMPSAKGGLMADRSTVDGALFPFYGLPNRSIENLTVDAGVPVGFWRSVGYSLNCFFVESFIDELAAAAGAKPLDYRARLLAAAGEYEPAKRAAVVLEHMSRHDLANPLAPATDAAKAGRGFALTECFPAFVGQIAGVGCRREMLKARPRYCRGPPSTLRLSLRRCAAPLISVSRLVVRQDPIRAKWSNPVRQLSLTLDNAPDITVEIISSGAEIGRVSQISTPGIAPAVIPISWRPARGRSLPFTLDVNGILPVSSGSVAIVANHFMLTVVPACRPTRPDDRNIEDGHAHCWFRPSVKERNWIKLRQRR
jgi:isoquinoline 1-oxidoreductase beta subunit